MSFTTEYQRTRPGALLEFQSCLAYHERPEFFRLFTHRNPPIVPVPMNARPDLFALEGLEPPAGDLGVKPGVSTCRAVWTMPDDLHTQPHVWPDRNPPSQCADGLHTSYGV